MRWSVLGIWLLPAFCEDLTRAASSHGNLTTTGASIITIAVWIMVVSLWMFSVRRFIREETKTTEARVLSNGLYVSLEGDEYLMVPADKKLQEEVRKENRRAKHIARMKQS